MRTGGKGDETLRRRGREREREGQRGKGRVDPPQFSLNEKGGVGEGKSRRKVRESGKMENSAATGGEGVGGKPPNIPFFDSGSPLAPVRDLF